MNLKIEEKTLENISTEEARTNHPTDTFTDKALTTDIQNSSNTEFLKQKGPIKSSATKSRLKKTIKTIYNISESEKETLLYAKSVLKTKTRKKARLHSLKILTIENLKRAKVLIRNMNLDFLKKNFSTAYVYQKMLEGLPNKVFIFDIKGGGLASQFELAIKNLYLFIDQDKDQNYTIKNQIKRLYPTIDRTDARIALPKKYGGPGAKSRTQKSYR